MRRLLASILMIAAPVFAADFQPTDAIREAALGAVANGPGVQAQAVVDEAIRLPACSEPLSAAATGTGTVEVGCASAGWRLYVPVRIQRIEQVWVLARPVAAGQALTDDMLQVEDRDVTRIAGGALTPATPIAGQLARRSLLAGSVLQSQDLVAPRAVRRGDLVTLVSRIGAIEVRASGKALGAAAVSERVNVENLSSKRVVQGIVRSSGEVEVAR